MGACKGDGGRKRVTGSATDRGQAEGGHFDGDLEAESIPPLTCRVWLGVSVPQVNGQNVVKVGHRQVVNMIRQGGNTLMVKVVMVTRHPDMDEAVHKKGAPSPDLCGQAWTLHPPATATGLRLLEP